MVFGEGSGNEAHRRPYVQSDMVYALMDCQPDVADESRAIEA
jgi:hypothetical protein